MITVDRKKLICEIPPDIHKGIQAPMYFYGIRLKTTENVLVTDPTPNTKYYSYFDKDGIYRVAHIDALAEQKMSFVNALLTVDHKGNFHYRNASINSAEFYVYINSGSETILAGEPTKARYNGGANDVFEPIDLPYDRRLNHKLFSRQTDAMKPGDRAEKLHELVKTVYLRMPCKTKYTEFERCFHKIEKLDIHMKGRVPIRIAATITCASFVEKQDVLIHKKELDAQVLNKIMNDWRIERSGIRSGMLELSNLTLTSDHRLIYVFDIKKELWRLLGETA